MSDGDDDDGIDEPAASDGDGDPMGFFKSRAHAADYLRDVGLDLYEDDTGALVGEDLKTGEKYGGPNGAKIPPQVIVAFMMVHDATWQTVTSKKRGRGS